MASEQEKLTNLRRAEARLLDHHLKTDVLRPYLEGVPARTVAEACELMRKDTPV